MVSVPVLYTSVAKEIKREMAEEMNTEILFQPLTIAGLKLPNRVLMTTVKLGYGTPQGEVTERHIAFYVRRAEGGVGLIATEPLYIHRNGREIPTQMGIHDDELIPGLRRLTDAVHEAGGLIMAHINHAGRVANPKLVPGDERVSASDVLCPANQVTPRALTLEEIPTYVHYFVRAARRVREAGFDAVEIPFSHGYLIHQFLSPHTNRRNDEYGGSLENRLRFGREVIAAVREVVGDSFPIVARMNAQDHVEGGLTIEDAEEIALALEKMGVDALSVTSGTMCESVAYCLYPIGTPKAHLLPMSARIRNHVSIPVAVAGRIRTPDVAREALALGQADWIGLGRPFLADPDWVRKTEIGDEVAILRCAACHQGCLTELRKGHGTSCLFNPLTGREAEVQIAPVEQPRQVMVAGGGPAGMEAAIIAAQRGHRVTLYERDDRLGGRFREAVQVPYKEEFADLIRYQQVQLQRTGVEVHLNATVTPETVSAEEPDAVVVATGAQPIVPPFPGLKETRWMTAYDLLDGRAEVSTPTAFIVGAGTTGMETAEYLAGRGIRCMVVKRRPEVGGKLDPLARSLLLRRLESLGVDVRTGVEVVRFETDEQGQTTVVARPWPHQEGAPELRFPAETVIIGMGLRADHSLADALADRPDVYTIGDCVEPREVLHAVYEGFEVGRTV
jgi:2,4-dienoyl-CoA reductase-like NADH-dependent reductase (Old Yellow Enzyme family)/pyruvate/2-oxoglutarate dehydrogenase complex dihydrolipoamide dehydrogenase (E3) component